MNKDELLEKFEKNVAYLQRNIPPDDIYAFAEQTFMAAVFFLTKWSQWIDLDEEAEKDSVSKKWIINILSLQACKNEDLDITLDLNLEMRKDNEVS